MMRPDELRAKMDAVEDLKRAVQRLEKAEALCGGYLHYDGHCATQFSADEINIIRHRLVEHARDAVTIKAGLLRASGIDPSSLLPKVLA